MKSPFCMGLVGCLLTCGAAMAESPASKIASSKGWMTDLAAAQALATKTGKPIMVVFRCDP